ncbi:ABC transporter substrate-binding protein [Paenibacillus pedocola]|uniref:ABC transporter substrate-binding protein n=1 Tax=Paenibacillus pedocola TaxID=3242193 RepID=UPI002877EECF|nr:ABC transporter substrate-binding protein [Paenibacillus typhae]
MTTKIRVILEYFYPWTNSAGFYYARQQGWYEEAGLDVELVAADPGRGDTLAYLDRNEADYGIFPSNRLLVLRESSPTVQAIAAINHRAMETIQTVKHTGILRPRDLSGKRVALNPTPRGLAMVRHLVATDGGNPDEIIWVNSGVRELPAESIVPGEIDATFGSYWAWELQMDSSVPAGQRIIWPVDEIGAPPYHSYQLGTRTDKVTASPDEIRTFLAVTSRGFHAVAADPKQAADIYEHILPYFPAELIARSLPLIAGTWLHEGHWGYQRQEMIEPYAAWLSRHGILQHPERWHESYTNEFLPAEV